MPVAGFDQRIIFTPPPPPLPPPPAPVHEVPNTKKSGGSNTPASSGTTNIVPISSGGVPSPAPSAPSMPSSPRADRPSATTAKPAATPPPALLDLNEVRLGEWRAFWALVEDEQRSLTWLQDHEPSLVAALAGALNNEQGLIEAVIHHASPEVATQILFANADRETATQLAQKVVPVIDWGAIRTQDGNDAVLNFHSAIQNERTIFDCGPFNPSSQEYRLCQELNQAGQYESYSAQVRRYISLLDAIAWFNENKEHIRIDAESFGIPPALLAGIIVSEMAWDYDSTDEHYDNWVRGECDKLGFSVLSGLNQVGGAILGKDAAPGYANVHESTFEQASDYLKSTGIVNEIPGGTWRIDYIYHACYLVTDSGAIQSAGIVARVLVEEYNHGVNLNAEQMAHLFAGYRQGPEQIGDGKDDFVSWLDSGRPLVGNAQFALPIMEYMLQQYNQ